MDTQPFFASNLDTTPPLEPVMTPDAAEVTRALLLVVIILASTLGVFLLIMFAMFLYLMFRRRC